jgi:hypothetical protein
MIEDELVKIWQSSPNHEVVKFEKSRLMLDMQSGIDKFNKMVKGRDLREMAGAFVAVPFMAFISYKSPYLLTKIGAMLGILSGVYVMLRLRNAAKLSKVSFNETYLQYLYYHKLHVQEQIHLLETVLYWYILPFYVSVTLMVTGAFLGNGKLEQFLIREMINTLLAVGIYYLNQYAVRKTLKPRLDKIDELIAVLEKQ